LLDDVKHNLRFQEIHAQAKILAWCQPTGIIGFNESTAYVENDSTIIEFVHDSGADLLANFERGQRSGLHRSDHFRFGETLPRNSRASLRLLQPGSIQPCWFNLHINNIGRLVTDVYRPDSARNVRITNNLSADRRFVGRLLPGDANSIAIARDQQITRAGEKNHRTGVFVYGRFMGDFLNVNVKNRMAGQVDGPGMHEVALKKNFDPTAILGNGKNQTRGILNVIDD
jgi:hypothetical protein